MFKTILELTSSTKTFHNQNSKNPKLSGICLVNLYYSLIFCVEFCGKIFILEFFSRSGMTIRFIFHGVPYGGNKEQIPIRLKARAF